jgi:hypothetical protein
MTATIDRTAVREQGAASCSKIRRYAMMTLQPVSAGGGSLVVTWNSEAEDTYGQARVGLVRSRRRQCSEVLKPREPLGPEGFTLVVFMPMDHEPVDVLLQLRSQLNDDEFALVSRALGY